jgi:putative PIN family toxin of toxin-antitoxin system
VIKVVLDTNVFVSSFFGGNPRRIIDLWKSGELTLCLSKSIVDEYVAVLQRLGLQDAEELKDLLQLLAEGYQILFSAKTTQLHVVESDPEDNQFFECAVALQADWIVSGDKAVIAVGNYMAIQVVSPKDFLDRSR